MKIPILFVGLLALSPLVNSCSDQRDQSSSGLSMSHEKIFKKWGSDPHQWTTFEPFCESRNQPMDSPLTRRELATIGTLIDYARILARQGNCKKWSKILHEEKSFSLDSGASDVHDIWPMKIFKKMRYIHLADNDNLYDVSPLARLRYDGALECVYINKADGVPCPFEFSLAYDASVPRIKCVGQGYESNSVCPRTTQ